MLEFLTLPICCAQWVKLHSEGVILVFMHLCFLEIFKITSSLNKDLMNIKVCCHCFLNPVKEMQVDLWRWKHKGYSSMKIGMPKGQENWLPKEFIFASINENMLDCSSFRNDLNRCLLCQRVVSLHLDLADLAWSLVFMAHLCHSYQIPEIVTPSLLVQRRAWNLIWLL